MAVKGDRMPGRVAYINARLLDPATGLDKIGGVLTEGEMIKAVGPKVTADLTLEGVTVIDCEGLCLAPGLVDMRVYLGEPGEDTKKRSQVPVAPRPKAVSHQWCACPIRTPSSTICLWLSSLPDAHVCKD